jgi:hypothetical protein
MEIAPLVHPIEDYLIEFKLKMSKRFLYFQVTHSKFTSGFDLSLVLEYPNHPIYNFPRLQMLD